MVGQQKEDLCGKEIVLYLDCSGGYTNVHVSYKDIELRTHLHPCQFPGFDTV